MTECSIPTQRYFTACASLAALGVQFKHLDVFGPIHEMVKIEQKTVKHAPSDKLYDAFISLLAGAGGLVEINSRLRADPVLQRAFGRRRCAEQSAVQRTLDACTAENVKQMEQAMDRVYQRHSQGYRHDYRASLHLLDVDMSGLPCGKKAAFATKGYFAKQRNRRGRQLGRVLASHYAEIVVDRLFEGRTQLTRALQPLMQAAERTLKLDKAKRARTIVRVDSGGGSLDDVNWLLSRDYQVHAKDYSGRHARSLAKSVQVWFDDPHAPERQAGWVTETPTAYVRPVRRIAVRCRQQDGQWAVGVLISTVEAADVLELAGHPPSQVADQEAVLWALVAFYDQRGGGIETSLKGDKQGLGLTRRNKKRGSRPANAHVAGQSGSQYGRLGPPLVGGSPTAILWDGAYDPRCLPYQWLSRCRCSGADPSDWTQSDCAPGFCPRQLVAGTACSRSHGHSSGQLFPGFKNHGR